MEFCDLTNRRLIRLQPNNNRENFFLKRGDYINDSIGTYLKVWDGDIVSSISRFIKPDSNVIDIGANIGPWSLQLSKLISGKVYAFEPQPDVFNQLCANLWINQALNVIPFRRALFNQRCEKDFMVPELKNLGGSGLSSNILNDRIKLFNLDSNNTYKVITKTLDSYNFDNISFIKIDVEGSEKEVLQGAINTIQKYRPVIVFECWIESTFQVYKKDLLEYMLSLDYNIYDIVAQSWGNYLAIPKEYTTV